MTFVVVNTNTSLSYSTLIEMFYVYLCFSFRKFSGRPNTTPYHPHPTPQQDLKARPVANPIHVIILRYIGRRALTIEKSPETQSTNLPNPLTACQCIHPNPYIFEIEALPFWKSSVEVFEYSLWLNLAHQPRSFRRARQRLMQLTDQLRGPVPWVQSFSAATMCGQLFEFYSSGVGRPKRKISAALVNLSDIWHRWTVLSRLSEETKR